MAADRRQIGFPLRHRPATQVRHLEDGQLFFAAAIVFENLPRPLFRLPEIKHGDAILAEQADQEVAAIRRDEAVVGLLAGRKFLRRRLARLAEVGNADLTAIEQRVGKLVARRVGQADDLGELAGGEFGRDFREQFERLAVESLDAARLVVLGNDDAAILRDRAADGIAGLDDAFDDPGFEQVDLGQPAVAAKDEGVAAIPRINGGGM